MPISWEDFINNLKDDAGILAKTELIDLVKGAKNDSEEFLKAQGVKIERYLKQLANGQITKKKFEGYMFDIKILTEEQALKMAVAAKARAQRLAIGIANLILDKLISLI
jgi:hypothetical protein